MEYNNLRKAIRKLIINECHLCELDVDPDMMDEERITNPESKEFVKRRENFIASHIFGEKLLKDDPNSMYVAYSYGQQYPAFLWYKNQWFENSDDYINDDGTVNEFTERHKEAMRPTIDTHAISGMFMQTMIHKFMHKHGIKKIDHTSVEPGTRN